jgi:hypothetical protein
MSVLKFFFNEYITDYWSIKQRCIYYISYFIWNGDDIPTVISEMENSWRKKTHPEDNAKTTKNL